MIYLIVLAIIGCMMMSIITLFLPTWKEQNLSFQNFLFLGISYIVIMIGFGLLYVLLELEGVPILIENGEVFTGDFFDYLFTGIYFSGITLFSVGYGDLSPVGFGRGIALVESWLGYTIPAAFVVKTFLMDKNS
ncbi:potassium channel LctB [Bacillus pakistanensis]|uniref:Potassium channel LctB n=2 Tax=Rossellomorea TaxID=2837508 RepID=A0ABS2NH28_9BACI|nr:potassium channel LctB [Bacillus pakistanensis]